MSHTIGKEALEALCAHDLKLLETGYLSDFSVVCGDHIWKAHKAILCRIEYFEKLIASGFKESHENQINIPNFQPFEIDLLLRYIYHPSVDAEFARLQGPNQSFLETCVRLWQLGDYYRIETLAKSAEEQLRKRTERYIAEAGHVADMLMSVPFVPEMAGAIRVAWDPEKAPGPPRRLLLCLCKSLAPYLRDYPEFIALFDEIPEFASDFSKGVLGCGVPKRFRSSTTCRTCGDSIPTKDADLRERETIYHLGGTLMGLNSTLGNWYCSRHCFEDMNHTRVKHHHCEICKRQELDEQEVERFLNGVGFPN